MILKLFAIGCMIAMLGNYSGQAQGVTVLDAEFVETDAITPAKIEHGSEQIFIEGNLEQDYNYLTYEFETESRIVTARSYLAEMEVVSIYGPFSKDEPRTPLYDEPIDDRIIDYFSRRYYVINRFGPDGYVVISE